jgi:pilus assembly protein FimV
MSGNEPVAARAAGPSTRDIELDVESLGPIGSELHLPEDDDLSGNAVSDLDFKIEDLENLEDLAGEDLMNRGGKTKPESSVPATVAVSAQTPVSGGGASLDSLDITPAGKDSASSDVLSSQWQMDSGLWDEVATKIDLARAYMEMEDPEAARGILEEVAAEGNDQQKAEAREMLSRLD